MYSAVNRIYFPSYFGRINCNQINEGLLQLKCRGLLHLVSRISLLLGDMNLVTVRLLVFPCHRQTFDEIQDL
jgi:hypothetical protein